MTDIPEDKAYLKGCGKCEYGIIGKVDYKQFVNIPIPEIRVLLIKAGQLRLCDCPAGVAMRMSVRNTALRMQKDPYYTEERKTELLKLAATPTVNGG